MRKKFWLKLAISVLIFIVFVYAEAGIDGILALSTGSLIYVFIYYLLYVIEKKIDEKNSADDPHD